MRDTPIRLEISNPFCDVAGSNAAEMVVIFHVRATVTSLDLNVSYNSAQLVRVTDHSLMQASSAPQRMVDLADQIVVEYLTKVQEKYKTARAFWYGAGGRHNLLETVLRELERLDHNQAKQAGAVFAGQPKFYSAPQWRGMPQPRSGR